MVKSSLTVAVLMITFLSMVVGQNKPTGLLVNLIANTEKPSVLIQSESPLFSWIVHGNANGTRQLAYQLIISDSFLKAKNGEGNVWKSGKQNADSSIAVTARA
jgi:hypothetical protein